MTSELVIQHLSDRRAYPQSIASNNNKIIFGREISRDYVRVCADVVADRTVPIRARDSQHALHARNARVVGDHPAEGGDASLLLRGGRLVVLGQRHALAIADHDRARVANVCHDQLPLSQHAEHTGGPVVQPHPLGDLQELIIRAADGSLDGLD